MMTIVKLTKMEAARRQLRTAIELWLADGDPVSIQTLAAAARTVIDDLAKHRKHKRFSQDEMARLLSVTTQQAHGLFTHAANYFKHANRDADVEATFNINANPALIAACLISLLEMGEAYTEIEVAFVKRYVEPLAASSRGNDEAIA
jgi:hypothetical protein